MAKKSVKVDEDLIRGYMAGREPDNVSKNETSVQEILNEAITTEEEPVEEVVQEKPKPRKKKEESNYRQKYLMKYTDVGACSSVSEPSAIRANQELFARDCSRDQHCKLSQ